MNRFIAERENYRGPIVQHPLYRRWNNMKQRCSNPNNEAYHNYGGRGIKVCDRWTERGGFWNFVDDMGECPDGYEIDRIDNDGNYTPENCQWTTTKENRGKKRPYIRKRSNNSLGELNVKRISGNKNGKEWQVRLTIDGNEYYCGSYWDKEDAGTAAVAIKKVADAVSKTRIIKARIDELGRVKKLLPSAHLDSNGCWHYEARKIDNPTAERLAELEGQLK